MVAVGVVVEVGVSVGVDVGFSVGVGVGVDVGAPAVWVMNNQAAACVAVESRDCWDGPQAVSKRKKLSSRINFFMTTLLVVT